MREACAFFSIWNMKGYFDTIPIEIEEASKIDGASDFQLLWKVVMPLARPAIIVTSVMVLIFVWNEYLFSTTFLLNENSYTLAGGLYQLQSNDYTRSWGNVLRSRYPGICSGADYFLLYTKVYGIRSYCRWCERIEIKWKKKQFCIFHCHNLLLQKKEDRLVIRIRCKKGDLKRCVLLWGRPGGNGRATSGETK